MSKKPPPVILLPRKLLPVIDEETRLSQIVVTYLRKATHEKEKFYNETRLEIYKRLSKNDFLLRMSKSKNKSCPLDTEEELVKSFQEWQNSKKMLLEIENSIIVENGREIKMKNIISLHYVPTKEEFERVLEKLKEKLYNPFSDMDR